MVIAPMAVTKVIPSYARAYSAILSAASLLTGVYGSGMRSVEPQLKATALSLASDMADPFENPLGGDWLSTGGVQRIDWYASSPTRDGSQARPVSVTADITGNNFFIREEADVDKVAQAIADKVNREVDLA